MMKTIQGTGVSGGVAAGRLRFLSAHTAEAGNLPDPAALSSALEKAKTDLDRLSDEPGANGEIFRIHRMMLEDEDFTARLFELGQERAPVRAVQETGAEFAAAFRESGDDYLSARADDIDDVTRRLTELLSNAQSAEKNAPVILAASRLLPGDLAGYGENLLGIVTETGSPLSHVTLMARALGIPAVIHADLSSLRDGELVTVDGNAGTIRVGAEETIAEKPHAERKKLLPGDLPCPIYANIGSAKEGENALKIYDGIGLFRTEYLFLSDTLPDEEAQFEEYSRVLKAAAGKPVTVRTADLGADKCSPAFPVEQEENPALGCRGIRFCFAHPELFRTQLRALLRAAVFGNLRVMLPMIIHPDEVKKAKKMMDDAAKTLKDQGIPFAVPPLGIMIETPAAAVLSDDLAAVSDFFSIGTNDLTQYTLAADRQNADPALYDPENKAILRLVRTVAANAANAGIPVTVCGDLASDPDAAKDLLAAGVNGLSVN